MNVAAVQNRDRGVVSDQLAFLGYTGSDVIELQALKLQSGNSYTSNQSAFVRGDDIASMSLPSTGLGVYLVANGVVPEATLRRTLARWHRLSNGDATTDADIATRRVLPFDCDPHVPVKGISATDGERARARALADAVRRELVSLGVSENAIAEVDSGNGYQAWVALDALTVDDETDALIRRCLTGMAVRVSVDGAKIDTSIHDRKRLLPCAGTMKRKGTHTPERPHRPVTFTGPTSPHRLTLDELRALADKLSPAIPVTAAKPGPSKAGTIFDRANAHDPRDVARRLGLDVDSSRGVECPGCRRKSSTMAAIVDSTEKPGQQLFKCLSDTCSTTRNGQYTPVDAVVAVRKVSPIEAAQWIVGDEQPKAKILGSLSSRISRLGSTGPRLKTGFPTFDAACRGGLPMQRVVVVGGAPGAAKTSTVAQWALRWAKQGIPVAFLAADEEADGILVRWGQHSGIDLAALEAGKPAARAALEKTLGALPLCLVDSEDADETVTIDRVSRELAELRGDATASVLIVDSIQIAAADDSQRIDSPRERIDAVVKALKRAAKRDKHLVIATSELARGAYRDENTINPLAAFKESGSIEYGVGTALVLRTVDGEPGSIAVEVPKNRIGRSADAKRPFRLRLDFDRCSLTEVEIPLVERGDPESREAALDAAIFAVVAGGRLFSGSAVYEAVRDSGTAVRKATVINRVKALVDEGALSGGGKVPYADNRVPIPDR